MYEKRVVEVRKKISIAQAELERIKENRKITKKGKRNRAVLEKECKGLSATKLVSFMEKQKAILRKLKRGFSRSQKNEEARILNQQDLPQGDTICPRLFTVCVNPIAWKISASEGYRLSKPISTTITDLLYSDDLKIFAASESKLSSVMNSVRAAMEECGAHMES